MTQEDAPEDAAPEDAFEKPAKPPSPWPSRAPRSSSRQNQNRIPDDPPHKTPPQTAAQADSPKKERESTRPPASPAAQSEQPNNPLHGVKLVDILEYLVQEYGWEELSARIDIRCFYNDPSIKSSLKFLRQTQWARDKVERLYLRTIRRRSRE